MIEYITIPLSPTGGGSSNSGLIESQADTLYLSKKDDKLSTLQEKAPVNKDDILLIEDSEDSNKKKRIRIEELKPTQITSTDNAIARFDGDEGVLQDSTTFVSDNGYIGIGTATPSAPIEIEQNDPAIKMKDNLVIGLKSEVNGQLIDFGTNYKQLGGDSKSVRGGFFRIDVRTNYSREFFSIIKQKANQNRKQESIFRVSHDGRVSIFGGNPTKGRVLRAIDSDGLSEWAKASNLFQNGNDRNKNSKTQIFFGWNGTSSYRHSISTQHDSGNTRNNRIIFKVWNKGLNKTGEPQRIPMVLTGDGYVGIRITTPSQTLDVNGNTRFRGAIFDGSNSKGTNGQILSSTGDKVEWIDLPTKKELSSYIVVSDDKIIDDKNLVINTSGAVPTYKIKSGGTLQDLSTAVVGNGKIDDDIKSIAIYVNGLKIPRGRYTKDSAEQVTVDLSNVISGNWISKDTEIEIVR